MEQSAAEKVRSNDGTPIAYYRSGAVAPLLLVHGSTADHQRWARVVPAFERHFSVYTLDRRGRGGSGDAADYDVLREAEDVAAVAQTAGEQTGEPVSVLGHSFGAVYSLEAAALTEAIGRLILYEPPLPVGQQLYAPDFPDRMKALIDTGEWEAALLLFFREEVKMPEHEMAQFRQRPVWKERVKDVPTVLREIVIDRTYRFDPARFAEMRTPTLLLLGGDSPILFNQAIEALARVLPDSRTVTLPGQGHIAMDTAPKVFLREVLMFLREEQADVRR